jgi:hypothetical protein
MNKRLLNIYYFFLFAITIGMAGTTVFTGSTHVSFGHEMSALEKQKQVLVREQLSLQQEIHQQQSLTVLTAAAEQDGYVFSQNVIRLTGNDIVASR